MGRFLECHGKPVRLEAGDTLTLHGPLSVPTVSISRHPAGGTTERILFCRTDATGNVIVKEDKILVDPGMIPGFLAFSNILATSNWLTFSRIESDPAPGILRRVTLEA